MSVGMLCLSACHVYWYIVSAGIPWRPLAIDHAEICPASHCCLSVVGVTVVVELPQTTEVDAH